MLADSQLTALSPLDGRYSDVTKPLSNYFSEFALIKYRLIVELRYLEFLSKFRVIRPLTKKEKSFFESYIQSFSLRDAIKVKSIERETKHDLKALEYFMRKRFSKTTLRDISGYIHYGLTTYDTNDIAYGLMLADAHKQILLPLLQELQNMLKKFAGENSANVILGRTHGQPAMATTLGKEMGVFYARIAKYEKMIRPFKFEGKLNGAVGNYNALSFTYPNKNWLNFSEKFIKSFGLLPNKITTQILGYDNLVDYTSMLAHINTIYIGLCQDMWTYISRALLYQKKDAKQVGSSTMPQKVNPIDFENAEGNLQIANAYFELFARKLLISRQQRDLSDSTVRRTIGSALGHVVIAWKSIQRGIRKCSYNEAVAKEELNSHWEILGEAMQVYFKKQGDEKGYERVKAMLMGKQIGSVEFKNITKDYPPLAGLTPQTYIGLAVRLTRLALKK